MAPKLKHLLRRFRPPRESEVAEPASEVDDPTWDDVVRVVKARHPALHRAASAQSLSGIYGHLSWHEIPHVLDDLNADAKGVVKQGAILRAACPMARTVRDVMSLVMSDALRNASNATKKAASFYIGMTQALEVLQGLDSGSESSRQTIAGFLEAISST